jgi:hypothetical protein
MIKLDKHMNAYLEKPDPVVYLPFKHIFGNISNSM